MRKRIIALTLWLVFAPVLSIWAQNHTIVVTWTASPDFKTGWSYKVYRGPAKGQENSTPISSGLTGLTYTDSNVASGDVWVYGVTAVSPSGGESSMAESAGCTVGIAPPGSVSCNAK